jgi:CRP-like cAMP-binding protein
MLPRDSLLRPLFDGLEPHDRRRLTALVRAASLRAGRQVFRQGEPAERFFLLERGEVALQLYPEDGGCLTIGRVQAGGAFGWSAVLGRPNYSSSALALTDVRVLAIQGAQLRAALRADTRLGTVFVGRLVHTLTGPDGHDPVMMTRLIHQELSADLAS